ncbi:MAG: hypothetical protein GEU88_15535 [Solirubrobacterales bacterium]|nr:hypothetical protein [Solirubrobacterales bacterium]
MAVALPLRRSMPALALAFLAAALGILCGIEPIYGLAAALGAAFVLVLLVDLYAGLIIFILVVSLSEAPGFLGGDVTLSKLLGGLLLATWLAHLAMRRGAGESFFGSRHPAATWLLAALLAWVAITGVWAPAPAASIDGAFRLFLSLTLFLIAFTAVHTRSQVIGLIAAIIAGACLDAAIGLTTANDVADAARLAGGQTSPGELAAVLAAGLVLSLGLARVMRGNQLAQLAALGAGGLCLLGVFMTGSRAGLIAVAVALVAFIAVGGRWRGRALIISAAVVALTYSFFAYAATPEIRERVTTVGSGSGRVDLWTVGWRMVEDEPLKGIGYGNYPTSASDYVLEPGAVARGRYVIDQAKVAHNMYLQQWAETGLIGLVLFLAILAFCLSSSLRAGREFARAGDQAMEMLCRVVFAATFAVLAGAFFGSNQFEKDLWLVLALGPVLLSVAGSRRALGAVHGRT